MNENELMFMDEFIFSESETSGEEDEKVIEETIFVNQSLSSFEENFGENDLPQTHTVKCEDKSLEDVEEGKKAKSTGLKKVLDFMIEGFSWTFIPSKFEEEKEEEEEIPVNAKRKYNEKKNRGIPPKIVYKKARAEKTIGQKVKLLVVACVIIGFFFGYMSNSYYIFTNGEVNNAISCAFGWTMAEGMEYSLSPFFPRIFFAGFFVGLIMFAMIGGFIIVDKDYKTQSRVGYEHGKARLGNARDFRNFKKKFMD